MGAGMGMGMMGGRGGMGGGGGMGMAACRDGGQCPMAVWMDLLANHAKIDREFTPSVAGIQSLTTSQDPRVAGLIQTHVAQMHAILRACAGGGAGAGAGAAGCMPVRPWDPLFAAVFKNAKDIRLQVRWCAAPRPPALAP